MYKGYITCKVPINIPLRNFNMPKTFVTWTQNVFGNAKVEKKGKGQYGEEKL
jgi:hypothetical protein